MGTARRPVAPARRESVLLGAWVIVLAAVVLGPTLAPGFVLSYDMVWVPHLSLERADLWGLGSGLPRAVPSDALVGLLGVVLPQQVVQKTLLMSALVAAGAGGAALMRGHGRVARWSAATLMVWNPFVAERLGLGHWPLLIAYAAVPWLVIAVRERRFGPGVVLLALTALTPASGVMGAVVALVVGPWRDAWRWLAAAAAVNAPWLVAALGSPAPLVSDPDAVGVFASRGAGSTPVWLEVATLGGVWNSDVRPASRETVVATVLCAVIVAMVGIGLARARAARDDVGRLVALWLVGLTVALVGAVAPQAVSTVVSHVPGAGLVRDGSRWVLLLAPATAVGLATCVEWLASRVAVAGWLVGLLLPVALVPDLGFGLAGQLRAVEYPASWDQIASVVAAQDGPGDLVSVPFSAFRAPAWNHGRPVLDPAGRYFDRITVTDDTLRVGGTDIAGEDLRAERVGRALDRGDWQSLGRDGIGWIVRDRSAPSSDRLDVSELPVVASAGSLELRSLPADVTVREPSRGSTARRVAVVAGWLVAALAVSGAAVAQIGRRRKTARGR